jgi:hypothetical protein
MYGGDCKCAVGADPYAAGGQVGGACLVRQEQPHEEVAKIGSDVQMGSGAALFKSILLDVEARGGEGEGGDDGESMEGKGEGQVERQLTCIRGGQGAWVRLVAAHHCRRLAKPAVPATCKRCALP